MSNLFNCQSNTFRNNISYLFFITKCRKIKLPQVLLPPFLWRNQAELTLLRPPVPLSAVAAPRSAESTSSAASPAGTIPIWREITMSQAILDSINSGADPVFPYSRGYRIWWRILFRPAFRSAVFGFSFYPKEACWDYLSFPRFPSDLTSSDLVVATVRRSRNLDTVSSLSYAGGRETTTVLFITIRLPEFRVPTDCVRAVSINLSLLGLAR